MRRWMIGALVAVAISLVALVFVTRHRDSARGGAARDPDGGARSARGDAERVERDVGVGDARGDRSRDRGATSRARSGPLLAVDEGRATQTGAAAWPRELPATTPPSPRRYHPVRNRDGAVVGARLSDDAPTEPHAVDAHTIEDVHTLRGHVRTTSGAPVAGAVVLVDRAFQEVAPSLLEALVATETRDDGSYVLARVPNDRPLAAMAVHATAGWSSIVTLEPTAVDATVDFEIATPGAIEGRVTRAGRSAIGNVLLTPDDSRYLVLHRPTAADGTFRFAPLAPGGYIVSACLGASRTFDLGEWTSERVVVASGEPTRVEIDLGPDVAVNVIADLPDGASPIWVRFSLVSDDAPPRELLLGGRDATDRFLFHQVAPGDYTACVAAKLTWERTDPEPHCRDVAIAADPDIQDVVIPIPE